MAVKGNMTMYLCAGTGLDMENSVWLSRFAYHDADPVSDISHTARMHMFGWLKAHAISQGYWYMNRISPSRGYFDVGRQTLVKDYATAFSQEGLGDEYINNFLADPKHNYELGLAMVDYVVWSDDDGNPTWTGAFVDRIEFINISTARVYFTVDAIISYQQYFIFGPSWIEREHVFAEWTEDMKPRVDVIGTEPEPFAPDEDDMIFEPAGDNWGVFKDLEDLGAYDVMYTMSDIELSSVDYIKPRADYPAFPAFEPPAPTQINVFDYRTQSVQPAMSLNVGLYRVNKWNNDVFKELGKYDAFEHLLYTYVVPRKIAPAYSGGNDIEKVNESIEDHVGSTNREPGYGGYDYYSVEIPSTITDAGSDITKSVTSAGMTDYRPLNAKTYYAPFMYLSVSDCMGASTEFIPQALTEAPPTHGGVFRFEFVCQTTILPNVPSSLFVKNYKQIKGGMYDPMMTVWQYPAYAMTPNASGWGTQLRDSAMLKGLTEKRFKASLPWLAAGGIMDAMTAAATSGAANMLKPEATAAIKAGGSAISNVFSSMGGGILGGAVTASNGAANNQAISEYNQTFGLPKAQGGLPNGATILSLSHPGYKFFFAHVNNLYLRKVDDYFSMYGYAVNRWKYPNINTRRRWNYVKTKVCILEPVGDNWAGTNGMFIPRWAQEQIKQRMNSGVTFWNLRYVFRPGDSDDSDDFGEQQPWTGTRKSFLFCNFVKNYGLTSGNAACMKDNQSIMGGYASADYFPDDPAGWRVKN